MNNPIDTVVEVTEQEISDYLHGDYTKLTMEKLQFLNETKRDLYEAKYPLPRGLAHPKGFVEEVMNYINETAVCPQPMFSLAAALSLGGTLYGRRVQSEDGLRTNLFCMTVGYTSCGKDHALKSIARILDECGASHLRLSQVTSDSAIEWALKRQPRFCLLIDEAGHFFANASDPAAKGSPQHAIKPALLELWSSAGSTWIGKQRVPKDNKPVPPLIVKSPHLNLYATTQPQIMFESLSRNDLRDGWLARNLFFISQARPKPVIRELKPVPMSIRAEVLAWKGEEGEVNLPPIATIPTSDEAKAVFTEFNDRIYAKMIKADKNGDEVNYLYGKALENARRIALILAVSRGHEYAMIERDDAQYAVDLVDYLINELVLEIERTLAETSSEREKKRMLKFLTMAGKAGLTRCELTRKTQFLRRTVRDEYLEDLIESGEIVLKKFEVGGKVETVYLKT